MKTLLLLGRTRPDPVKGRLAKGVSVLAWDEPTAARLKASGVPVRTPADLLSAEDGDRIDDAAIAWTRAWGKRRLYDGQSFRELWSWKGFSLWWFAELYLFHCTASPGRVRLVETFHRILAAEKPDEVEVLGLGPEETVLLGRTCTARGILFHGPRTCRGRGVRRVSLAARWNTVKAAVTATKAWLAGRPRRPAAQGARTVLFLSHAAFWKRRPRTASEPGEYEHYFDRLIPEVAADPGLEAFVVAVGPSVSFRRRRLPDQLGEWAQLGRAGPHFVHMNRYARGEVFRSFVAASQEARALWRRLRRSPGMHEAFTHRGVAFDDLAEEDLAGTLLLQLPWAVRCYEEMTAALQAVRPAAVCLYAEGSGWGRAAVAACRGAGVPTLAIQHGIIYPRYFSYLHDPDDGDCPRPDRTAVFGAAARRFLIEEGRYAPESLVVTGSPKFDALLEAARSWDREALRARFGVEEGERLLVVASRYRSIRPTTHQSIGSAFAGLVRAVEGMDGVRLLVKPHPAEPAGAYVADIRAAGARRSRVLPPSTDLLELLFAADALVTVESLSAVEALVLGRPVLILNMPSNLREMVERGVALGAKTGEDPADAVRRLLFDPATREDLSAARTRYLPEIAFGLDGGATRRMLALIREAAGAAAVVG